MSSWKGMKRFLPSKECPVCQKVFCWQKKWSQTWHRVAFCSTECREQGCGSSGGGVGSSGGAESLNKNTST